MSYRSYRFVEAVWRRSVSLDKLAVSLRWCVEEYSVCEPRAYLTVKIATCKRPPAIENVCSFRTPSWKYDVLFWVVLIPKEK